MQSPHCHPHRCPGSSSLSTEISAGTCLPPGSEDKERPAKGPSSAVWSHGCDLSSGHLPPVSTPAKWESLSHPPPRLAPAVPGGGARVHSSSHTLREPPPCAGMAKGQVETPRGASAQSCSAGAPAPQIPENGHRRPEQLQEKAAARRHRLARPECSLWKPACRQVPVGTGRGRAQPGRGKASPGAVPFRETSCKCKAFFLLSSSSTCSLISTTWHEGKHNRRVAGSRTFRSGGHPHRDCEHHCGRLPCH